MEMILMASEKIVCDQWALLDLECHILPHNSGSAKRIVLQFCIMKGAKRDMEI